MCHNLAAMLHIAPALPSLPSLLALNQLETDALKHWKAIVILWFIVNGVNAMPSPEGTGFVASPLYKWIFTLLHSTFGMLPRIVATFVPQSQKALDVAVVPPQATAAEAKSLASASNGS